LATSISATTVTPRPLVRDRVDLLGARIDRLERHALTEWLAAFLDSGRPHQVVTANLDFIAIARRRPSFARVIDSADLVVCDGKPLQWASRLQGEPIPARVTGMDLVLHTAKLSAERGYRIFFMGGAPGVAARAGRALEQLFPGVVMAGTLSPRQGHFEAEEDARIVAQIRAARPDALFVALGAPRQDEWIQDHLEQLGVPLCAGIGGVFNFLAGETRRAPEWIQQMGMEWAFRLAQEPSRLWRRYLVDDLPLFFELVAHQAAARLRAPHSKQPGTAAPDPRDLSALAEYPLDRPARGMRARPSGNLHLVSGDHPEAAHPRVRKRACR
jgi:N-acetylglucosaminyldiphosphoundecaprenol N-acetyl-beta-D-mannosaminyltransferase